MRPAINSACVGTECRNASVGASQGISPAPDGYELDYRMDMDGARFQPTDLPIATEKAIQVLMKRLGLVFGAIDLRRTADRGDVFLEVNPAGEWRFVEERTSQPITQAVAELLADLDHP